METHKFNTDGSHHLQKLKYKTSQKVTQNADKGKQSQPMPLQQRAALCRQSNPNAYSTVQLSTNTTTELSLSEVS